MMWILGKPWQEKVEEVRKRLELESADMFVVTALDEVACKIQTSLGRL